MVPGPVPRASLCTLAAVVLLSGCARPAALDPSTVRWLRWSDPGLGVSLEYPDAWRPEGTGGYVPFRRGRTTPFIVRWVDEEEARARGLWAGAPSTGRATVGGMDAVVYAYEHGDGPFTARMVAVVVPWRGKLLGFEFRTDGGLDPVQEEVLHRVVLSPPGPS